MPQCQLCKDSEADKTGSHIFSFFLIRDVINKENAKRRDNEISFELSPDRFVQTYFGPEILPEQIVRIKGKQLEEKDLKEIEEAENPFTEDHIVCTPCEKRLGTLENYVSARVFDKLRAQKIQNKDYVEIVEFDEAEAIRLFIYSLCWRAAIVDYSGFRMHSDHQEKLRRILDANLHIIEADLKANIKANTGLIKSLPLLIAFMETQLPNDNYIYASWSSDPYWMIVNDFHFQLFFKQSSFRRNKEKAFGINTMIRKTKSVNLEEEKCKISIIPNDKRKKVNRKVARFMADKMMNSAKSIFNRAFRQYLGRNAPLGIMNYFIALSTFDANNGVEKFTPERFSKAAVKSICEYAAETQIPLRSIDPLTGDLILTRVERIAEK